MDLVVVFCVLASVVVCFLVVGALIYQFCGAVGKIVGVKASEDGEMKFPIEKDIRSIAGDLSAGLPVDQPRTYTIAKDGPFPPGAENGEYWGVEGSTLDYDDEMWDGDASGVYFVEERFRNAHFADVLCEYANGGGWDMFSLRIQGLLSYETLEDIAGGSRTACMDVVGGRVTRSDELDKNRFVFKLIERFAFDADAWRKEQVDNVVKKRGKIRLGRRIKRINFVDNEGGQE